MASLMTAGALPFSSVEAKACLRTLANAALSPFELKPYAPWIMRFLRTRSSLNYKADFQNHLSYLPPIEVLKQAFTSTDENGKAPVAVSSKSSYSSVSRDEEYELDTKEGTLTFLNFFGGGADQSKSSLRPIFLRSSSPYRCDRMDQVRPKTSWR